MSDYEKTGPLDAAIDDAVREMMQVDPRPGLRYRVAGSISSRSARTGGSGARLAWSGALAGILLASLVLLRPQAPPPPSESLRVVVPPAAAPAFPPAGRQVSESSRPMPAGSSRRREPAPESIFGPRTTRVAAANVPTADVAASSGSGVDAPVAPLPVPRGLSLIAPLALAPIHVAPLAIQPLTMSALPIRR
jgi:hypothetical protein